MLKKIIGYLSLLLVLMLTTTTTFARPRFLPPNSNYNLTEAELTMGQDSISKKYYWLLTDITTEADSNQKYDLKCYRIPRANNLERAWNAINP